MEGQNEFNQEIYNILQEQGMPAEVGLFINMAKTKIKSIYECENVLSSDLEEFIDFQFDSINPKLNKIEEDKIKNDFDKIHGVISEIRNEEEENSKYLQDGKQSIVSIQTKDEATKTSKKVVGVVSEIVESIQSKSNTLKLGDEDLEYTIDKFKSYITTQIPQDLRPGFEKDYKEVLKLVSEKFEEYYME